MKRILKWLLVLLLVPVVIVAIVMAIAHWKIRQIEPPLPSTAELQAALAVANGPINIQYVNTASQPRTKGKISHPGILFTWADGHQFLVDSGMEPSAAIAFGELMAKLSDAGESTLFGSIVDQLGERVNNITGVGFSHLHEDHSQGITSLCNAQQQAATVYQTPDQANRYNYLTYEGRTWVAESQCDQQTLADETIKTIPGFPGLVAIAVGGHTPGSTIFAATVGDTTWILAGDINNVLSDLKANLGKGFVYSTFITPENTTWLTKLRVWLNAIDDIPNVNVIVAHDIDATVAAGMKSAGAESQTSFQR